MSTSWSFEGDWLTLGNTAAQKQGSIYDKWVIPFEKRIEKYITFPFGLSLTAILKKR